MLDGEDDSRRETSIGMLAGDVRPGCAWSIISGSSRFDQPGDDKILFAVKNWFGFDAPRIQAAFPGDCAQARRQPVNDELYRHNLRAITRSWRRYQVWPPAAVATITLGVVLASMC